MKNSSHVTLAALAGALLASVLAPAAAAATPEAGLLGKRYAGPDFTYDHFSGSSLDQAMGASAVVNLPLRSSLDLLTSFGYLDTSGPAFEAIDKRLSASLVTHRLTEYGTGYFAATLGHDWSRVTTLGMGARENGAFWGVHAGYEIPVARRSAVNLGLGYSDAFDRAHARAQVFRAYAEANHWFSADVAGLLSATYKQLRSLPDAISYGVGLRWAF